MNKLSLSDLLSESVEKYKQYFARLFLGNLVVMACGLPCILLFLLMYVFFIMGMYNGIAGMLPVFIACLIPVIIFIFILMLSVQIGYIVFTDRLLKGELPLYRSIFLFDRRLLKVIGYALLISAIIMIILMLLFFLITGGSIAVSILGKGPVNPIFLFVLIPIVWIVSIAVPLWIYLLKGLGIFLVTLDGKGVWESFSNSSILVKGHKFTLFLLVLIIIILQSIGSFISFGILNLIISPWSLLVLIMFYRKLIALRDGVSK